MRFVGKYPILGTSAPAPFLSAYSLLEGTIGSHLAGFQLLDSVQEEPPCDESVEALLASCLALYLQTCWEVGEHDASGCLVHVLAAMTTGPDECFSDVGFTHRQAGHSFCQLLFLLAANRKCAHGPTLPGSPRNRKDSPGLAAQPGGIIRSSYLARSKNIAGV